MKKKKLERLIMEIIKCVGTLVMRKYFLLVLLTEVCTAVENFM